MWISSELNKLNLLSNFITFRYKESELQRLSRTREAELKYQHEQNTLDVTKTKEMAGIETDKFKNMVSSIGSDTIQAIATAGPEMQVRTLPFLFIPFTLLVSARKNICKNVRKNLY